MVKQPEIISLEGSQISVNTGRTSQAYAALLKEKKRAEQQFIQQEKRLIRSVTKKLIKVLPPLEQEFLTAIQESGFSLLQEILRDYKISIKRNGSIILEQTKMLHEGYYLRYRDSERITEINKIWKHHFGFGLHYQPWAPHGFYLYIMPSNLLP